jgi:hypothetical protein
MGSILNVSKAYQKSMDGFVQHLEHESRVENDSVVFPPHMRSVNKN